MLPRGRGGYRYGQGRGMPHVPMPGISGGMLPFPYDMGGAPLRDAPRFQQIPIGALATALANAPPEQQRTVRNTIILLFTSIFSPNFLAINCCFLRVYMCALHIDAWRESLPTRGTIGTRDGC